MVLTPSMFDAKSDVVEDQSVSTHTKSHKLSNVPLTLSKEEKEIASSSNCGEGLVISPHLEKEGFKTINKSNCTGDVEDLDLNSEQDKSDHSSIQVIHYNQLDSDVNNPVGIETSSSTDLRSDIKHSSMDGNAANCETFEEMDENNGYDDYSVPYSSWDFDKLCFPDISTVNSQRITFTLKSNSYLPGEVQLEGRKYCVDLRKFKKPGRPKPEEPEFSHGAAAKTSNVKGK